MDDNSRDALRLLEWYCAMGADEALSNRPVNWYAWRDEPPAGAAAAEPAQKPLSASPLQTPGLSRDTPPPRLPPARTGDRAAPAEDPRAAASLDALQEMVHRFDGCALKKTATKLCFARGNPESRLMLIGEAPGRDEDMLGLPFVGRAGQLLDRMLAAIGLSDANVYITNIVYWRPPGNRTPTPQEALACQPFLERQIELVDPEILVLLGGAAAKHMLNSAEGIMRLRGKWTACAAGGKPRRAIATLHPAYLLRNPVAKRLAWRDMLAIRAALDETP